jgi:RimJ/RimL family protein N-acetyltransferase
MAYGYEGKKVRLVPLDFDRHFANLVRWINDPEVTEWLLVGDYPMTALSEKEWFDSASRLSTTEVHFAIETLDGVHLGTSALFRIDYRSGTAVSGSMIGATDEWGKGYGTDAAKVRARYAFEVLGLRMLYSEYLEGNVKSARMQEKAGYKVWGVQPKSHWKRGAFRDHVHTYLERG